MSNPAVSQILAAKRHGESVAFARSKAERRTRDWQAPERITHPRLDRLGVHRRSCQLLSRCQDLSSRSSRLRVSPAFARSGFRRLLPERMNRNVQTIAWAVRPDQAQTTRDHHTGEGAGARAFRPGIAPLSGNKDGCLFCTLRPYFGPRILRVKRATLLLNHSAGSHARSPRCMPSVGSSPTDGLPPPRHQRVLAKG